MWASRILRAASNATSCSHSPLQHSPLTGLFAVNKPTGLTSTTIVDHLQHVCQRNRTHPFVQRLLELDGSKRAKRGLVKVGHGGTLDPLARGIVVVGLGAGTKQLHGMSASSKVYIAEGRLGFSSTTLDCTGSLVAEGPTNHIAKQDLIQALCAFKGEILQTPPLYSAISMDGKRLYDYAREGLPLPRDIPTRKVQIHGLELLSFPDGTTPPDPSLQQYGFLSENSNTATEPSTPSFTMGFKPKRMKHHPDENPDHVPIPSTPEGLVFHIRVHCSSGTYIRTLIADIAAHLGTVGHMTDLLRVEQSGFKLGDEATLEMEECEDLEKVGRAIQAGNRVSQETS